MRDQKWSRPGAVVIVAAFTIFVMVAGNCNEGTPAGGDARPDAAADADGDRDYDRDYDAPPVEAGPDGDSPCLPDPDADADADNDIEPDSDHSDATLPDADDDVEDEPWIDADLGPCPDDMVGAGSVCIDMYEASRSDSTATDQGVAGGRAYSQPSVIPWHVNPMSVDVLAEFQAACEAAGKRLCTPEEWGRACSGPAGTDYVFGDAFDREACNCVDTYCDDYCVAAGIPADECNTSINCGYVYSCFLVVPTGQFPGCTNVLGTLDMNGNVWEVVPSETDERGYEVRGGAYNCASAPDRLQCSFNAGWDGLYAGFRCCLDR